MRDDKSSSDNPFSWKYLPLVLVATAAGFLAYSSLSMMHVTHARLSIVHHHKLHTFCSFTGNCLVGGEANVLQEDPVAQKAQAEEAEKLANITNILSTRVCGSPAIDGYAHVVPKCLEDSPTNKWWQEYYANGGKQSDLVVHIERHSDYDGLAVVWGITNKKNSVEECAQHCLEHMPNNVPGPFEKLPCNAFAFCPEEVCFEPDAHHHTKGDCWLKFTEGPASPEVNMRGDLPDDYRQRHSNAPKRVHWHSGVLLPRGVNATEGVLGPRWKW